MVTPATWGPETLVNSTTNGSQTFPIVTALDSGRYVIAWVDWGQNSGDTSSQAVRAQIFNADGSAYGAEFLENSRTTGSQNDPGITALAGGQFVIAYKDGSQSLGSASGDDVRLQVFNADGARAGAEILANTTTLANQTNPAMTTLADGRFLMAWADYSGLGGDTSGYGVKAQLFSASGAKIGSEFRINTTTEGWQANPQVAALNDGRIAIAWSDSSTTRSDNPGETSGAGIRLQLVNADGSLSGAEMQVNSTTAGTQSNSCITALAGGGFVITWDDYSQSGGDTSVSAVRGQVFGADGAMLGPELLINTKTTDNQHDPEIAALADGRFVAVWTDSTGDGTDSAVHAQIFTASGAKSGAAFSVATTTAATQGTPAVAGLADGRFVVTWTDFSATGADTSSSAIRSQIFDPRLTGVTVQGSVGADDYRGTGFSDRLVGDLGADLLMGYGGKDRLRGDAGNDTLVGGDGSDVLSGAAGFDLLKGGSGADQFVFLAVDEISSRTRTDRITDFVSGQDKIDLSAFLAGGQFVGGKPLVRAGDVAFNATTHILSGDVDGDGIADFRIKVEGTAPVASDFLF